METMTPEQVAEVAKGLTFEKVWLAMMELMKALAETPTTIDGLWE
jgi:hypothetical protein